MNLVNIVYVVHKVSEDNFEVFIPGRDGSHGNGTTKETAIKEATYSLVNNIGALNTDYKDIKLDNIDSFNFTAFSSEYRLEGAHIELRPLMLEMLLGENAQKTERKNVSVTRAHIRYAKANGLSLSAILKASIDSIIVGEKNLIIE